MYGNKIREFLEAEFLYSVDWNSGPIDELANGKYPFPDAPDRWQQWRKGTWVSADGVTTK